MYEIDLSTDVLIGLDELKTRVITSEFDRIINENTKNIVDNSCKYFGSSLMERVNMTKRLVRISSKSPVIIEESKNIIFFPLKSVREKNNIWISFNNIKSYIKEDNKTLIIFNDNQQIKLDFSYYIVDNQITRCMMLDYELKKRKETLQK